MGTIKNEPTLLDWAIWYYRRNWCPVPAKARNKMPTIQWQQYQSKRPSLEQVTEWFKGKTLDDYNIALILGETSNWLCVVDFDNMDSWKKAKPEIYESKYLVAVSGSGKRHLYVQTHTPTKKSKITELGIDIQAQGSIIIAPPSIHPSGGVYHFINQSLPPMEVDSIDNFLRGLCARMRVKMPDFTDDPRPSQSISNTPMTRLRPCIQKMIESPWGATIGRESHGLSHDARKCVANEGFSMGLGDSQVAQLFSKQKDYNYGESMKQVKSLRKSWVGRGWRCDTIKKYGFCPGDCH